MNKLTSIRIKQEDGTYSEDIPVQVLASNVLWRSGYQESLLDIIGQVDVGTDGSLQHQIDILDSKKVDVANLNSYLASQISTDVTNWLNANVDPVGSAIMVDESLSIEGAAADSKITGELKESINNKIYHYNIGMVNLFEYFFQNEKINLSFLEGQRGATSGSSVEVVSANLWSCSTLFPVEKDEIYTIINTAPEKFRFTLRGYTDNEENEGIMVSNSFYTKTKNLKSTTTDNLSTNYSSQLSSVYKNTACFVVNTKDATKYCSIHVRRLEMEKRQPEDIESITNCIHIFKGYPILDRNLKGFNGDFGYLNGSGGGRIRIDTENKTLTLSSCTFKSGAIRINNPATNISNFQLGASHWTFYLDYMDSTIKVATYTEFSTLAVMGKVIYLGSAWPVNNTWPKGYYTFNSNMTVSVDGVDQFTTPMINKITEIVENSDPIKNLKVLVTGDSICRGGRNGGRGFIGDVGCQYVNIGIGGATLSTAVDSSQSTDTPHQMEANNIPDTIVKYATKTTEDWYMQPDVIIMEGGINDYGRASLGAIPTIPIKSDTEADALDQSTVMGGLQFGFWKMINLFPNAHRFFLTVHRVASRPYTASSYGYTQTELNEAIEKVCKLYGVDIIDVFNKSFINSYFDQYISPTSYKNDHSVTTLYHIDNDKLHPLALGYRTGYAPLVKDALYKAVNLEIPE